MDREEILSKVNKNNELDEMELAVVIKALGISTIAIPILCLVFIITRILEGNAIISDLVAITFAQILVSEFYGYMKVRKTSKLVLSIILLIITLIAIGMFFYEVRL